MSILKVISHHQLYILMLSLLVIGSYLADLFFSFSHVGLITFSLIAMMQFSTGAWFRSIIVRSISIITALLVASVANQLTLMSDVNAFFYLTVILLLVSCFIEESLVSNEWMYFLFTLALLNFLNLQGKLINSIMDVLCATVFMLILSWLATIITLKHAFIQLACDYISYLSGLINRVDQNDQSISFNVKLPQTSAWIFALGFSAGYRASFRYYLLQLERAVELLLYINSNIKLLKRDHPIYETFLSSMHISNLLLNHLQAFFLNEPSSQDDIDWMEDITLLQKVIHTDIPINLQSMHFNQHNLIVYGLFEACKDLRQILLQLLLGLPKDNK